MKVFLHKSTIREFPLSFHRCISACRHLSSGCACAVVLSMVCHFRMASGGSGLWQLGNTRRQLFYSFHKMALNLANMCKHKKNPLGRVVKCLCHLNAFKHCVQVKAGGARLVPAVYRPPLHCIVKSTRASPCQNQSPSHNPPVTSMQTKSSKALINYL